MFDGLFVWWRDASRRKSSVRVSTSISTAKRVILFPGELSYEREHEQPVIPS